MNKTKGINRRSVIKGGLAASLATGISSLPCSFLYASRPQRVFFGMLAHETNSFSPMASNMDAFNRFLVPAGELLDATAAPFFAPLHFAREKSAENNWQVFQGLATYGAPGGPASRAVYEQLRDRFLADLKAVMPVDVVALMLHGAMLADGYDNCEGDLLKHVRQLVGKDAVIGAVLDSHAHLNEDMIANADFLIATKEYPHIDFSERSEELINLLDSAARKEIKPVFSVYDCRMIDAYHTPREPMRGFVDKIQQIEKQNPDVLSISVIHSFPWADSPVMGTKMLVITDDNESEGRRLATELGKELFSMRGKLSEPRVPMNAALDRALKHTDGLVVLADAADNPGGGAPCDSTFILQALVDREVSNATVGRFYDPLAIEKILQAGQGAKFKLPIGGMLSRLSGQPVELEVEVRKILLSEDKGVNGEDAFGFRAAWVQGNGIDIVVGDSRGQTFIKEDFLRFGIPLQQRQLVAVKSSQHFYASFAPIASEVIYVDTPGVLSRDLTALPFKRITRPKWPFDESPFG